MLSLVNNLNGRPTYHSMDAVYSKSTQKDTERDREPRRRAQHVRIPFEGGLDRKHGDVRNSIRVVMVAAATSINPSFGQSCLLSISAWPTVKFLPPFSPSNFWPCTEGVPLKKAHVIVRNRRRNSCLINEIPPCPFPAPRHSTLSSLPPL